MDRDLRRFRRSPSLLQEPLACLVPDLAEHPYDNDAAERILIAYQRATKDQPASATSMWEAIRTLNQKQFMETLNAGDPCRLAGFLRKMYREDATNGTCQGRWEIEKFETEPEYRLRRLREYQDKILSLAEAVGVRVVENPEQGAWGASIEEDVGAILIAIEEEIGFSLRPPPIDGGLLKLDTSRGLFHERDLYSIFTAWSIAQHLGPETVVCEIGGGVGKGAFWTLEMQRASRALGSTRSTSRPRYTILDLPHIGALQAFTLIRSGLGCALYGESVDDGVDVAVVPYFAKSDITSRFDVVLNQDSLPELPRADALDYLAWMKKTNAPWFYSVNHESRPPTYGCEGTQLNVSDLVREVGGFVRRSRSLYWLREGYVAELYRVQHG